MDPIQALAEFLGQNALKREPRRLLVALSGGADSIAVLRAGLLVGPRLGWSVEALHCEHGLRGRASRGDAAFVRALCVRLKVPILEFQTLLSPGPGLEERARNWRRTCYLKAARERQIGLILLGHHARDQAETVLLNLVRGSGAAGAAGMLSLAPIADNAKARLGRPFLALEPEGLRAWLRARRQSWREDSSNRDPAYARNRVRLKILPELERINPKAVVHLASFAATLASSKEARDLAGILHLDQGARRRAASTLARGQGRTDLGHGWTLNLSRGQTRVDAPAATLKLNLGLTRWNNWRFELKLAKPTARNLNDSKAFWFSPDFLAGGARLRRLKAGERLKPFGFAGRRKAMDLMREAGVPVWAREDWPALEAEGRLLALPGVRRGSGFEALRGLKALKLTWEFSGVDKARRP